MLGGSESRQGRLSKDTGIQPKPVLLWECCKAAPACMLHKCGVLAQACMDGRDRGEVRVKPVTDV